VREGTAIRAGKDRYYARSELEETSAMILTEVRSRGEATTSELRAALGFTRKHLIPILEWMDAQGMTVRDGDVRRVATVTHPSR
jgi:selenocysteine-specific elongation factor